MLHQGNALFLRAGASSEGGHALGPEICMPGVDRNPPGRLRSTDPKPTGSPWKSNDGKVPEVTAKVNPALALLSGRAVTACNSPSGVSEDLRNEGLFHDGRTTEYRKCSSGRQDW